MNSNESGASSEDPCPQLPIMEVGEWSVEKHELLRRYIGASWAARQRFPSRSYIDLYCGPGRIRVRSTSKLADGGAVAAWREAAKHGGRFTQMIVSDKECESSAACKDRLDGLGAPAIALSGAAADTVDKVLEIVPQNGLHLAFLDPYNIEHLPFTIIEKLARFRHIDIVVHYSVMDVQRNLELDFLRDASKFEGFAPGWKRHVAVMDLPKSQIAAEFASYWLNLVKSHGFSHAREMPLLTNSKNGPLYRMVFLMRHSLAAKLWNDIARPVNRSLFDL